MARALGRSSIGRWFGLRMARRAGRSVPILGAAVSAYLLRETIRRKGFVGGLLDTGLNALPVIGALKSGFEAFRDRDIFPDRKR
ncbi:MAG TPA: hypothetical protein VIG50_16860 [Vicinamibacteria bacterium]|jgi:hypothetical protein